MEQNYEKYVSGERRSIKEILERNAGLVYEELTRQLSEICNRNPYGRAVAAVCGGSGAGKTRIAALLAQYLWQDGTGCCLLAGDHYPHRIPGENDAERLRIFRQSGIRGMLDDGVYTPEHFQKLQEWQRARTDANLSHQKENPWFASYRKAGRIGLARYLGTEQEQSFAEVQAVITAFKNGSPSLWLRHMGREAYELWYEEADVTKTKVLLLEWTHANSDHLTGIDYSILLSSTPQETLSSRIARNRDSGIDSPFTNLVLEIEQEQLHQQATKANLIISRNGELLSYKDYVSLYTTCQ